MPTAVGMAFLVALVLMLLAAINYQNSLAYALTFLLGSVFVVAILHTWRNLAGLVLQAGRTTPVFVGEQARMRVRLESRARPHQAVAVGRSDGIQLLDIPAGGVGEVELCLPTQRRGWLRPGRLRVESRFPLGILVTWSWVDLELATLVYPRPVEGELPLVQGLSDDEEQGSRAQGSGVDDYQGLRPWQPGDSRRRLNWKAYSRGQGLLVKDFTALAGAEPLLDLTLLDGDLEARLSLLCYWVVALTERQQPFALLLDGKLLAADTGEGHRDACLRALALFGQEAQA